MRSISRKSLSLHMSEERTVTVVSVESVSGERYTREHDNVRFADTRVSNQYDLRQ